MSKLRITEKQLGNLIMETITRVLSEERSGDVDSKIEELISFLHNAQKFVREIHWNTREYALHLVTDEAIGDLLKWEDSLAETFISDRDVELRIGDKKPSSSGDFKSIIRELGELGSDVKSKISGNKDYDNIAAVLDDIVETSNSLLYKSQLK
jgi:hypothetical protein